MAERILSPTDGGAKPLGRLEHLSEAVNHVKA